jgi:hypothetical protein
MLLITAATRLVISFRSVHHPPPAAIAPPAIPPRDHTDLPATRPQAIMMRHEDTTTDEAQCGVLLAMPAPRGDSPAACSSVVVLTAIVTAFTLALHAHRGRLLVGFNGDKVSKGQPGSVLGS